MNKHFKGFIGTYTKGESKGIYSFTLDTNEEKITDVKLAAELGNPTYVAITNNGQHLYSVIKDGDKGGVAAYSIDDQADQLSFMNKQLSEGASPCHVSVDSQNKYVVTANYHKGTVELFSIEKASGLVEGPLSVIEHKGSGPNKERQEKAHTHYSGFTPDEKYVVVVDLGIDQVITYEIKNETLQEVQRLSVKPGSGPRHIAFHPNGKVAYVMTELSSEVIVLSYNREDGSFTEQQYIRTISEDFTENNQGSAIHLSSDGKFVYVSNRGHNSIAVFGVDESTGQLEFVECKSTEGDWPRDFVLDPTERYLIVSNQETGNLVLFARDVQTGRLTLLQSDVAVPYPVCVKFLGE